MPVLIDEIGPVGKQATRDNVIPEGINRRQMMPRRQTDDQLAMDERKRTRRHNQAAIRSACKGREGTLNRGYILHVERAHLHPERWRFGAICLSSSSHLPATLNSKVMKPVALPPGRAKLSTKPAPTGSAATGNTIGTVRVTCNSGPTVEVPDATMTSGASATNSVAIARMRATSPAP